jgi:hypothetical protein
MFCFAVCYMKTNIKIYRTTILPGVLYGYKTWTLTLRGIKYAEDVRELGAAEDIYTYEEERSIKTEKIV